METFDHLTRTKFSDCKEIDQIVNDMQNIRKHMLRHTIFACLSTTSQHEMCITIYCMVTDTVIGRLGELYTGEDPVKPGKYDIKENSRIIYTENLQHGIDTTTTTR